MEKEYYYIGATVDEAIKKGLKDLALSEDAVKIEVIEGGSTGIFGLFKKEAKVKLIPLDEEYNKEEAVVKVIEVEKKEEQVVKVEKTTEEIKEVKVEEITEQEAHDEKIEIVEEETVVETEATETAEETVKKAKREDYIVKNQDRIVSYLQNIVIAMGYPDATVDFREDGNRHFTLNIKTEENTSLIIGKRGVTLNSLQFLVNNFAKKFSSHYFRIEVDCDDYRENRKKTLEDLALNLAKKSKKIGKPVELEPMTSIERKIIHNALTGIKNVETESRGEEPHRYLVITAK
ncbi:Jag N-terminal domain-containing protein [Gemella haemolysans]|uniref:RNA-binding protein KhpB n=1 Tax=Gemella haemolysans TaxID=1379 RepID=A0AAW6B4K7_9BACL|nr:RNA-binding cell elongation regulator Jag/EloR [Gemella haemolysans]MDB6186146.1 Jag N-terminal domain-containing protein [Gemella haemolysans]MDB6213151.1 Jag N-terminal domain-containing protein [Gemella haemolysans]MDU4714303.1 RNA-binding cell elongation regulator Jag/EloR [Gemella haemolysans]